MSWWLCWERCNLSTPASDMPWEMKCCANSPPVLPAGCAAVPHSIAGAGLPSSAFCNVRSRCMPFAPRYPEWPRVPISKSLTGSQNAFITTSPVWMVLPVAPPAADISCNRQLRQPAGSSGAHCRITRITSARVTAKCQEYLIKSGFERARLWPRRIPRKINGAFWLRLQDRQVI